MLINKQSSYSNGDIVSFKLANGDEIIAEVVEVTDTGWIVKKPCVVVLLHIAAVRHSDSRQQGLEY
jgi:uncharacterized protein YijF (DUF1287 family)